MATQIISYLNFNGQCREAMTFYKECFGGELIIQKIGESPMAAQMPAELGAQVLHSSLTNDRIALMGSDMMGASLVVGNAIMLCVNCKGDEEIHDYFDRLSRGGKVKTPLHQTFWGATYGELTDRYGIHWMFNFTKN